MDGLGLDGGRTLVVLPTYNEVDNLLVVVPGILAQGEGYRVLVVDDPSPDGTGELADRLASVDTRVSVLHRPGKQGLGTATIAAMRFAIEHGFGHLLNMDADFSHDPEYIPALRAGMADHDLMIGSRYVPGGGVEGGFTLKRRFMSTGINTYARLMLGLTSRDNSGAFRCYRVSKLARIDFDRIRSRGYSFQEEILYWCQAVGCRIGETPIVFKDRRAGSSKINMGEAASALWILFQLGVARRTGRKP